MRSDSLPVTWDNKPIKKIKDKVLKQLKLNYAYDNIDDDDFKKRLEAVKTAKDKNELILLVMDLPEIDELETKVIHKTDENITVNNEYIEETDSIFNIFGGTTRKGIWNPAREIEIFSFFGGADIDFRKARLVPGVCKINAVNVFGGLDIIVPPGVNVITKGINIMGGIDNKAEGGHYKDAPVIEINSLSIFGGIDIKVKKIKK